MSWNIGGVRIPRVVEHVMPFDVDFFAEATPADVAAEPWLVPDFVDSHGRYLMSFHTFVIETTTRRILVDTCTGNSKDRPLIPEFDHQHRPFVTDLAAAGFAPDTIDTVVCTHLHVDHVGWNTHLVDGKWVPTFPRARYLLGAADIDFWTRSEDPFDVLHHPIQCGHPEWTARGDVDPDTARATRRELLTTAAVTNALVLGTHFAGTSAGRVLPVGDGYRFAPEAHS